MLGSPHAQPPGAYFIKADGMIKEAKPFYNYFAQRHREARRKRASSSFYLYFTCLRMKSNMQATAINATVSMICQNILTS